MICLSIGYPNLEKQIEIIKSRRYDNPIERIEEVASKENVIEVKIAIPGGEDFSEFTKRVPCVYYYHGGNFGDERDFPQHSSRFDLNEKTLWSGVAVMTQFAFDWQDA